MGTVYHYLNFMGFYISFGEELTLLKGWGEQIYRPQSLFTVNIENHTV